jgi:hypothetical protein
MSKKIKHARCNFSPVIHKAMPNPMTQIMDVVRYLGKDDLAMAPSERN